jgi:hypothetical protein
VDLKLPSEFDAENVFTTRDEQRDIVETTVQTQTVSAPETTDEWPRIGATAWSKTNKPDCLKRMSNAHSSLLIYV